jgi:hypothetical protein
MNSKEYYDTRIKPFLFDDTVEYESLSLFDKIEIWVMAKVKMLIILVICLTALLVLKYFVEP